MLQSLLCDGPASDAAERTAIQDVWRVPLDPADRLRMRAFHGTTIRFYDQRIDAWRSIWIDPLNGPDRQAF